MTPDPLLISYISAGLALLSFLGVVFLNLRLSRLIKGSSGESLEDIVKDTLARTQENAKEITALGKNLIEARKNIAQSVAGIGVVKFNAFSESGGEQSFAVSLLDRNGDGVLISSVFTRERAHVYARTVERYAPNVTILPEEKEALLAAQKKHSGSSV